MKILENLILISAILFVAGCVNPQGERAKTGEAQKAADVAGTRFEANLAQSIIEWVGTKPTGQHNGTIGLAEGFVTVGNGVVTGGELVIDMNSIAVLDITDANMNGQLRGHLLSPDFFEVETYPTSIFVITSVEPFNGENANFQVTGNLTLKDTTRSITFPANIQVSENGVSASSAVFLINRADWNVKYGSKRFFDNLKDNFIHDDISLKFSFVAGS